MVNIINFAPNGVSDIWITIILWLVNLTSVVGGVVLFTLLLKLVTFPFDFMSRWSMRKNSVKMEQMRPELEKLQKQYADNKQMYNQKMMALYKKNGYSMFGACLPTILTLVIFIIAINGFQAYASYQNKEYFYNMSVAYNNVVYAGFEVDGEIVTKDETTGKIDVDFQKIIDENLTSPISLTDADGNAFELTFEKTAESISAYTTNGYISISKDFKPDGTLDGTYKYNVIENALVKLSLIESPMETKANNFLKIEREVDGQKVYYTYPEATLAIDGMTADKFILDIQQEKSAEKYREEQASFLWIKNIWVTDSALSHPIQADWKTFTTTHGYNTTAEYDIGQGNYDSLIAKLDYEKNAPNGYFILIALSIIVSFVTQVVLGKSQQAQMELQTVDGQGMQTQKTMKWVMPIMMAIFSFMYTAAFAIYIILSSTISVLTTLGINYFVDKKFAKQALKDGPEHVRGRIYVEKEQPKKEEQPKKKAKDEKFSHESKGDFLDGKSSRGHIRGRIK